ncbi:MFS transporter [Ascidiimonas sp. W6]|uniref:MFS transporter n=1 Tax=Ascidiimonas meishanensis TaxID=3128903 RepID=UPI0030EDFD9F
MITSQDRKPYYHIILLVFFIFFVISFITNILNSIISDVREGFDLSLTATGFLPFSFFIAYGIMSIPAGFLAEKYTEKLILKTSFILVALASLGFTLFPAYLSFLATLFCLGSSMAVAQVVINPLLRIAGGESNFAFNSVMAQLVFGLASFASPYVYQSIVSKNPNWLVTKLTSLVPPDLSWIGLYILFAFLAIGLLSIISLTKFPSFEKSEDEKIGAKSNYFKILKNKTAMLYFAGIFAYVGVEQGIGNWISVFLEKYHAVNPQNLGADVVAYFWGMLTLGCILGLILLKFFDSRKVLIAFTLLTIISLVFALFGNRSVSLVTFPLAGFFISVMWSIIFSLALNSVKNQHGTLSGILCTGIAGGAIIPFLIGWLSEYTSIQFGMLFMLLPLVYILSIGFWAKPIITNKTISLKNV